MQLSLYYGINNNIKVRFVIQFYYRKIILSYFEILINTTKKVTVSLKLYCTN